MGVLADVLHLFNVAAALRSPVIAWSAGAMALAERIVLFHDRAPQGPGHPEVYASGLSVLRGIVPLPHARARLLLDDRPRMAVFASRFAPARCVLLESGTRMDIEATTDCRPVPGYWPKTATSPRWKQREHRQPVGGPPQTRHQPAQGTKAARARRIDRFLARERSSRSSRVPGARFLFHGAADDVHLVHQIFGLPGRIPLRRIAGTGLWYLVLELPDRIAGRVPARSADATGSTSALTIR